MNKVSLMGRLTRDVEIKTTEKNILCNFSLAVNRRFSKKSEADFINIVAWDKTAEFCSKYFVKGQQVGIIGRIQVRSWDDADGKKKYATEVVAEEVYFADAKKATAISEDEDDLPF